ncbi:hypothetical protein F2Q70_00017944 [Brassica cretica]|uniref:Uncharacterized protein n=1 Tax=Brassica cretica TaxID=69181 RepID=A0A8S9I2Y5_BRACR|nr:hypothetical protein F2Q70_00017944 [Brassica cretica]
MEDDEQTSPPIHIPDRIFTVGEEPVGVRVTMYHKPYAIRQLQVTMKHEAWFIYCRWIQSDVHTEGQTPRDSPEKMVTDNCHDAILFANQATSFTVDGLNGGQEIQSDVGIL